MDINWAPFVKALVASIVYSLIGIVMFGISFLVMVVGMFLVPGLSLMEALLAILVGAILGNFLLGLVGTGQVYGGMRDIKSMVSDISYVDPA